MADRMGFVRSESLGRFVFSVRRSIDFVSIRRRLGALGRRSGGGGRRKPANVDGGGEGESVRLESGLPDRLSEEDDDEETLDGIIGRGDRRGAGMRPGGLSDIVDDRSSSGGCLVRYVV